MESTISKFTRGGYLVGDIVTFKKNFQSLDSFKKLSDAVKARLQDYATSDLPVRVRNVKNLYPSNQPGNLDSMNGEVVLDIAQEIAPSIYKEFITVPGDLFDTVEAYPNLTPVANSLKYDNKVNIKPVPVAKYQEDEQNLDQVKHSRTTQQGDKVKPSETTLNNKNVVIPHGSDQPIDKQAGKKSYTSVYLGKK